MSLWRYEDDIEKFNDLIKDRQDEILKAMLSYKAVNYYGYASTLSNLIGHLSDKSIILNLFNHFINNSDSYALSNEAACVVVHQVYEKIDDKQYIKNTIKNTKHKKLHKALLLLSDKTEKEEELGLRAIAGSKYAPHILYAKRYTPSLNAVKNLPPITRLNALEALSSNTNMAYNLFKNLPDEDEFRALLFGAVLRHRDRVEVMCDKYNEIKDLGKEATVVIKCKCENCGEYEIIIKSTRVRTQTGLSTTNIGRYINNGPCSLCGRYGENEKQIICEG